MGEKEQKPVSVLYVKRKRSDAPNQSLIVSFNAKKQKIFNEFTFVESTKAEPTHIEDVLKKHKSKPQVSAATIKDKVRDQKAKSARSSRYNIISSTRNDSGIVYTASEVEGDDEIVCNAEKMFSEKLTLSETGSKPFISNGEEEWVYDVYLSNDICAGTIDSIYPELELADHVVEEEEGEDSDSNDENYWGNDYPDENSSDSDNSEGFYYNMNVSNTQYRQRKVSDDYYDKRGDREEFNFGVMSDTSESSAGEEDGDKKEGS